MTYKTFFTASAILLILLAGFFSVQLLTMPATDCIPILYFECDAYAQILCGGGGYWHKSGGTWCDTQRCMADWAIYCDAWKMDFTLTDYIYCPSGDDCSHNGV